MGVPYVVGGWGGFRQPENRVGVVFRLPERGSVGWVLLPTVFCNVLRDYGGQRVAHPTVTDFFAHMAGMGGSGGEKE